MGYCFIKNIPPQIYSHVMLKTFTWIFPGNVLEGNDPDLDFWTII